MISDRYRYWVRVRHRIIAKLASGTHTRKEMLEMAKSLINRRKQYLTSEGNAIKIEKDSYPNHPGNPGHQGGSLPKGVSLGSDGLPYYDEQRLDMTGKPFDNPTVYLPPAEFNKVMGEIAENYKTKFAGKKNCTIHSFEVDGQDYYYKFENRRFGDFNIYNKYRKETEE